MKLDGKVRIVTGGASGMGRAVALLFEAEGSRVVIADLDTAGAADDRRTGFASTPSVPATLPPG